MFKRLKKSVIDKNNLLLINVSKKRVNKTPSKIVFPNRSNLTFANIIVNMNSTPSFRSIDSWNNSYFNTELYNNSYSKNSSKNSLISRITSETKDDHSEILSIIINGILCLKSNELLNYFFKLIEIITYIRDNRDKYNYIDINSEMNKDLLMIIYQIYFRIFPENSFIYLIIKNDLKKEMKIFKNIHSIYILYILTGLSYINDKSKTKNLQLYHFLKQFIKKEKCSDLKCPICVNIEIYEKNISSNQKPSVIKIMNRKFKKINDINSRIIYGKKKKKNIINISNDNIIYKKNSNNNNIERNNYSNIVNERSSEKNIIFSNRINNDLPDIKKKIFYSQLINSNKKEKVKFINHRLTKNNKNIIQKTEKNNHLETIDIKQYNTEKSNKKLKKISGKIIDVIKVELNNKNDNKLVNNSKKKIRNLNKIMDLEDNNSINNNRIFETNKSHKTQLTKTKKIKINVLNAPSNKNDKKICINLEDSEKKKNNNGSMNEKKENVKSDINLNESSKIIKDNINLIEKEIIAFKEHNLYIKQQLEKMLNKNEQK